VLDKLKQRAIVANVFVAVFIKDVLFKSYYLPDLIRLLLDVIFR